MRILNGSNEGRIRFDDGRSRMRKGIVTLEAALGRIVRQWAMAVHQSA